MRLGEICCEIFFKKFQGFWKIKHCLATQGDQALPYYRFPEYEGLHIGRIVTLREIEEVLKHFSRDKILRTDG